MRKIESFGLALLSCAVLVGASEAMADSSIPSKDDMWKIIQQQQQQIKALTSRLDKSEKNIAKNTTTTKASSKKVEAVAKKAKVAEKKVASIASSDFGSFGESLGWWNKTSLGGYGELHLNSGKTIDEIDFHRFVLFVNHEFNDRIRLYSELELEHAESGAGKNGEVELEQAFIEMDINENMKAKAGLMLLPVGILNETHEPPTFYGTERNPVEKNIIPTTWWEAGVGLSGHNDSGFSYDLVVHSGLETPITGGSAFKIRDGRGKGSEATAENGAATARVKYNGITGLEIAASVQHQLDITQGAFRKNISATLITTHIDYKNRGFGLKALYAGWGIDGTQPAAVGRDKQFGYYVEPSYRFNVSEWGDLGFFGRYNYYDNNSGDSTKTEIEQYDIGLNFWPHPDVVLKADMSFVDKDNGGIDDKIFNLGVGFQY